MDKDTQTQHSAPASPAAAVSSPHPAPEPASSAAHSHDAAGGAAIISICTILSRLTGFARTWAMAFALGATFLSSSYQVANNLPNMLYELVMGGMLATAFLPVYMSEKKRGGKHASDLYASNLLTLVTLVLGVIAVLCMIFPAQVIYTQSFYSDQQTMGTATLLFRFFAIQVVFYGASSILSGILNANRDYIWGAIAPVFNNIIVIATFLAYAAIAPINETLAIYVIAIGNPLGVFVQLAIQVPGAKRAGIQLRPYLDLKDPALRETASIGLPAIIVTICSFVTVSVANAASYAFADNGPSVIAYSRLWFTFPYSFLAIPVATTMFTELSAWQTDGQSSKVVKGIGEGAAQIMFLMVPMAMLLIVFSVPLVTLYHVGAFSDEAITQIARYLAIMALALPFYGVNTHLQMAFSAIRRMGVFSVITLIGSAAQVAVIAISVAGISAGAPTSIEWIAAATVVAYLIEDVLAYIYLARAYSQGGSLYDAALKAESAHARTHAHAHTHTRNSAAGQFALSGIVVPTIKAFARSLVLGGLGALVGWALLSALQAFIAPIEASLLRSLIYTIVAGGVALVVTFGLAIKLDLPEALFVTNIWKKVKKVLSRKSN